MKVTRSAPRAPRRARPARRTPPAMEWVEDVSGRCARATAIGSRSLLVENYTSILEFTEARVRLDTGRGPLRVDGRGLSLRDVRPGALIVCGEIHRVDLPCGGEGGADEG